MRAVANAAYEAQRRSRNQAQGGREAEVEALRAEFMNRVADRAVLERIVATIGQAASRGLKSIRVYTFPSEFCTDRGRAINNDEAQWSATLCGEAASVHALIEAELGPLGYVVSAQIVTWPELMPGDVGIIVGWDRVAP
ncbi:hypothetical protein B2G71_06045 [Novosphingobium sp. PC22D]|nr:hypothetical protein B2G71_06045 [Novosphingobium sp. PC22D]